MSVDELARAAAGDLRRRIDTAVDPDVWMSGLQHKRARRTRLVWVSAAAATAVLVAAFGWIAIRPTDGANSQPFDEPSPTHSESVSPTPEPTDRPVGHVVQQCGSRGVSPCPDYRGHLEARLITGDSFLGTDWSSTGPVNVEFDLPDTWRVLANKQTSLQLGPATGGVTMTVLQGPLTGSHKNGYGDTAPPSSKRDAEEIIDWLTSNSELASTEPITTTVDGRPAWDVQVEALDFVPMFGQLQAFAGADWWVLDRGKSARIIVVDGVNNAPLVIWIRDNPEAATQSETDITRLIDTVTLKTS